MHQAGISHGDLNTNNIIIYHHNGTTQKAGNDGCNALQPSNAYDFVIIDFERARDHRGHGRELRIAAQGLLCCDKHAKSLSRWCIDHKISTADWYVDWPGIEVW